MGPQALERVNLGGAAVPTSLIEGLDRHGLTIVQGWGMTETSPLGAVCRLPRDMETRRCGLTSTSTALAQGIPIPLSRSALADDDGALIPWDDQALGELEIRGPWVAAAYHRGRAATSSPRTAGSAPAMSSASMRADACASAIGLKDLVKSGGEWISSVDLENQLMAHPAVAEAAVIAIPDDKWGERPLAAVVLRDGVQATPDELREHLGSDFAKWQLPDRVEFVDAIPRTATGKFKKTPCESASWRWLVSGIMCGRPPRQSKTPLPHHW